MSAIFTATSEGQEFGIEITREGELVFLNYDIECDFLRAELGEAKTPALKLADEWIKDPIRFIVEKTKASDKTVSIFFIECAEHVFHLFEGSPMEREFIKERLIAAKDLVKNERIKVYEFQKIINKIGTFIEAEHNRLDRTKTKYKHIVLASVRAADSAGWAISSVVYWRMYYKGTKNSARVSDAAAEAAAYSVSPYPNYLEWKKSYSEEQLWQINHFLDMEKEFV